jgi:hypothetical protein
MSVSTILNAFDKITATQYNNLVTDINNVLGPTTDGYGQTLVSSNVSQYAKITAAQWALIKTDLLKISAHQGTAENAGWTVGNTTTIPTLPSVAVLSKITAADVNKFIYAIQVMELAANRYKVASGQFSENTLSSSQRTAFWGGSTNTQVGHAITVTWTNTNEFRYFWNSGGRIRFRSTLTGTTGTTQDNAWVTIVDSFSSGTTGGITNAVVTDYTATAALNAQGTGSSLGGLDLTAAYQQTYTKTFGSGTIYVNNDYTIGLAVNNATTPTSLLIRILFRDDTKNTSTQWDRVTGTLTSIITAWQPTGANVSLTAPTVTLTRAITTDGTVQTIP